MDEDVYARAPLPLDADEDEEPPVDDGKHDLLGLDADDVVERDLLDLDSEDDADADAPARDVGPIAAPPEANSMTAFEKHIESMSPRSRP